MPASLRQPDPHPHSEHDREPEPESVHSLSEDILAHRRDSGGSHNLLTDCRLQRHPEVLARNEVLELAGQGLSK